MSSALHRYSLDQMQAEQQHYRPPSVPRSNDDVLIISALVRARQHQGWTIEQALYISFAWGRA